MAQEIWDDDEYEEEDDEWEEDDEYSCDNCGPWCPEWGGDGLCMIAIEQQAEEYEDYHKHYVQENVPCPICGKVLTQYDIPINELWLWPGDFYNPIIALEIFAILDAPKGELHRADNICHIWVGAGKHRRESLIRLTGKTAPESDNPPAPTEKEELPF